MLDLFLLTATLLFWLKARATLFIGHTKIGIQLFQDDDKARNGIIVEVQRKNDSSILFHKAAQMILNAARGDTISLKASTIPRIVNSNLRSNSKKFHDKSAISSTIEFIECLLRKDRFDANVLAMESLLLLTDSNSSSLETIKQAAHIILSEGEFYGFKEKIFALISQSDPKENEEKYDVEDMYISKMRSYALSALANSLQIVSTANTNELASAICLDEWNGEHGLLSILIEEYKHSHSRPHNAYQAARCVKFALKDFPPLREVATQQLAIDTFNVEKSDFDHDLLGIISREIVQILHEVN